ncbi:MAG: NYN domain-containing protein [Streptosporangiaceae bacterium]|nr:NYN domain-containing protein [Streptosporangiaceae bacterium]MBV9856238.1 NYN domain-containing protein [Streptosporangiaceae bacterium]
MDRCALFVDAGYVLADGAMAVHGTRRRESVSWDYEGLMQLLASLARERSGLPLLRCYWYEATVEGRRSADHDALADLPGVKLRLAKMRPGRREGVEGEIHRDLTTLARNKAISDALVVSAEEDLAQVVADVQDLGLRVTMVHITVDGNWTISRMLRQECDDIVEVGSAHLRPYVELISGAEPPRPDEQEGAALIALRPLANGHSAGAQTASYKPLPAGSAGGHQSPPSIYTAPVVAEYQRPAAQLSQPRADETADVSRDEPQKDEREIQPPARQDVPARQELSPVRQDLPAARQDAGSGRQEAAPPAPSGPSRPDLAALRQDLPPARQDTGAAARQDAGGARQDMPTRHDIPAVRHDLPVRQDAPPARQDVPARQELSPVRQDLPAARQDLPPARQEPPAPRQDIYAAPVPVLQEERMGGPADQSAGPRLAGDLTGYTPGGARDPMPPLPPGPPPGDAAQPAPVPAAAGTGQLRRLPSRGPGNPVGTGTAAPAAPAAPGGGYGPVRSAPYSGPQPAVQGVPAPGGYPGAPQPAAGVSLADAVQAAHKEGQDFGGSVARDAPALWLEAVLARKPRMPSDLEARLLQGSTLPIDFLLHDEVRHALRRGFWDALERTRR